MFVYLFIFIYRLILRQKYHKKMNESEYLGLFLFLTHMIISDEWVFKNFAIVNENHYCSYPGQIKYKSTNKTVSSDIAGLGWFKIQEKNLKRMRTQ